MLCCVPKRPADGGLFHDGPPSRPSSVHEIHTELYPEEDAPPPILLPCAICARTFTPQSLEKHARICERSAAKKRKPFDSAKQRIQGTELAEFLPKQEIRRGYQGHERGGGAVGPSWKKTHDDFLRAIREARGDAMDSHKQNNSVISSGAPTRANEKGTCPTCNRHFGIKAYDRHVAWCKDRVTRVTVSPATNLAKERLEARMRYRAPALKNRRAATREKYSSGSAVNLGGKISSPASSRKVRPKESVSMPNFNRESPVKQKPAIVRRAGQLKESPISSGPMKSRLIDRTNRPAEDHDCPSTTSCRSSHLATSSHRPLHFPVPPLRHRIDDSVSSNEIASFDLTRKQSSDRHETISCRKNEGRNRETSGSARAQRDIVSARSQSYPKINDIAVNDKSLGVTVQPCRIYKDSQKDQLTTWKQISRRKNIQQPHDSVPSRNSSREFQLLDLDRRRDRRGETLKSIIKTEEDSSITKDELAEIDDELKINQITKTSGDVIWLNSIPDLNQTYLIKDSEEIERPEIFDSKWKPIRHSPRVEFYFKNPNQCETSEQNRSTFERKIEANDEGIKRHKVEELQINTKDRNNLKINDIEIEIDTEITGCKIKNLKIDSENEEDNRITSDDEAKALECKIVKPEADKEDSWKVSNNEAEVVGYEKRIKLSSESKIEKSETDNEDKEDNRKVSNNEAEVAGYEKKSKLNSECNIEKSETDNEDEEDHWKASNNEAEIVGYEKRIKLNSGDEKDTRKTNDPDSNELNANETDRNDKPIAIDQDIVKNIKYTKVKETLEDIKDPLSNIARDSSDSNVDTKLSTFDITHALNDSEGGNEFYVRKLEIHSLEKNDPSSILEEPPYSKSENVTLPSDSKNSLALSDSFIGQRQNCHPSSKNKISRYKGNTCCTNSLELKDGTVTFTFDRFKNNPILNKCREEIDCDLSPEDETLSYRSNACLNSLDTKENISRPASLRRTDSPKKNVTSNDEEAEIKGDRYEGDVTVRNKKSEKHSSMLKSEKPLPRNLSGVLPNEYVNARANDAFSQGKASEKCRKECFNYNSAENIEDKSERAEFIVDSDDSRLGDSNDRTEILARSIDRAEVMLDKSMREVLEKNVNSDVDYGSDKTVVENNARGDDDDLTPSVTSRSNVEKSRHCREEAFSNASFNFPWRVSSSTRRAGKKESPLSSVEIKQKIRENMSLLRGSTDSLISSVEFVELASIGRPRVNRACKRETIEIIRSSRRSRIFRNLPDIKDELTERREHSERSVDQTYWERASRISQNRLIGLDPSCHVGHKFAKRNPRVRILPPVPHSPLINRRKVELATRPAWCNYVRRRPDFNLVLKARTGTCEDYDPFLLAEQQMNDLLSDTSDQYSATSVPKSRTRDGPYPLSHSSAFVKYPRPTRSSVDADARSSLIAPPCEFDDLASSDLSSDSTETNSISREIFLRDLVGGKATDAAGPRPVRELGRRMIIDKSKALGSDLTEERCRGTVVGSADDRLRKNLDKAAPKIAPNKTARSPLDRSSSTRASSAPRTNSTATDRKISSDTRDGVSKLTESQRSSDRSLNRRNNNYSSLSGSNLSLSSIISSEMDIKRSNSVFDELMTSFEEDVAFPDLRSFLNNESFEISSHAHGDRQRNGHVVSDEELSSPDSYKPQDHGKLSNDSAYSSLNRKYSHHGRSTNDMAGHLDEDAPRCETLPQITKTCKMSKFCHECGLRFPENAKFCCECGVRRLAL